MNKDEDCICFYRDAVIAGHDDPAAVTMRRFNLSRELYCSSAERGHRTMRWSRYPQLESSAVEDASGRLGDPAVADVVSTRRRSIRTAMYPSEGMQFRAA